MRSTAATVRHALCVALFIALCLAPSVVGQSTPPSAPSSAETHVEPSGDSAVRDPRVAWLDEHAVRLCSIDPDDENFSDLEPLRDLIGDARLVQLGEISHTAGGGFAAKVRLIKFLHQRMGFDVLAWESGLYDAWRMNYRLASDQPLDEAADGVFSFWNQSAEGFAVFEYARRTWDTPRPLRMAGFDIQFSGGESRAELPKDLLGFFDAAEVEVADEHRAALLAYRGYNDEPDEARRKELSRETLAAVEHLEALLAEHRARFEIAHAPRAIGLHERFLNQFREQLERNIRGHVSARDDFPAFLESWNNRDRHMAQNLIWLAEELYPDRKIVVWAHNGHIFNVYYQMDWGVLAHTRDGADGPRPMGTMIDEHFGDESYTVAMVVYGGKEGGPQGWVQEVPLPEDPDSFERLCSELDEPYLFVDFRRARDLEGHWLRDRLGLRARGYGEDFLEDWPRGFDAALYIHEMTPATWNEDFVQEITERMREAEGARETETDEHEETDADEPSAEGSAEGSG